MAVRIKDIAVRVGVSRGTVDRVLHNRGNVAPHLKQKIENAISELGYKPNIIASRLVSNKPLSIGVVLPHFSEDLYWALPIQGIQNCMEDYSHFDIEIKTVYFNLVNDQSVIDACHSPELFNIDAVILAPVYANKEDECLAIFKKRNIPVVAINTSTDPQTEYAFCVGQNSYKAGYTAGGLFDLCIQGKPSILQLTIGQLAHETAHIQQRKKGLQDYFNQKESSFTTLEIPNLSNTHQLTLQIMTHIDEYGPVNGVLIANSKAYRFAAAMKKQQHDFIAIGFDLNEEHKGCLKRNELNFIIDQDPERQGHTAMKLLIESLILSRELSSVHFMPIGIVVKESIL